MSIIPPESSFIFAYLALLYNAGVSLKLVYNSLSNPRYHRKAWNLSSAGLILVGTVLMFFWFNFSLSGFFIWGGIVGSLLLFANNLLATILAFRNSIEVTKFGKVNYIFFTVLALQSFMLLLNFIEAQTIFRLPGFLEWLMIIPTVGYSAFQAFLYGPVGYFYPALILIPIVAPIKFIKPPEPEPEPKKTSSKKSKEQKKDSKESVFTEEIKKPEEKKTPMWSTLLTFLDNGSKAIFAVLFILLFVFSILNIGTFTSFSDFKGAQYNPVYPERSDFEFSVSLKTIYQQTFLTDYQEQFQEELILIKELNVSTVRIDVKAEIIDSNLTELVDITDQLHSNGFKIMMATYGYGFPTWNYQNVSLTDFRDTIEQQAETLILNCSPEYLLIYPEPFGFSSAFVDVVPTPEQWGSTINSTLTYLKSLTNDTEIGVNLSFNDFEKFPTYSTTVFEELWFNTSLDFLGLDFYIIHGRDLDLSHYLSGVSTSTKDFWICEFGVSAVMYGERIQEAAVARLLEICTNDVLVAGNNTKIAGFKGTIKGLNYFSLIDDLSSGNSLGLVGDFGHRRLSFYRYQEIIATVYA